MRVRLGRKYSFFAAHRLYDPSRSDAENARVFGKCSHPNGHGHTYSLTVVVGGTPDDATGMIVDLDDLDRVVGTAVARLAHKQIERDVPEFAGKTSTIENIVAFFASQLQPQLTGLGVSLDRIEASETRNNRAEVERNTAP